MTNIFTFVGTHRDDPDCLLLLGDDGAYYACPTLVDPPAPIDPIDPREEWVFIKVAKFEDLLESS